MDVRTTHMRTTVTTLEHRVISKTRILLVGLILGALGFVAMSSVLAPSRAVALDSPAEPVELADGPAIGVSKVVSSAAVNNDDASYTMTFLISVANLGVEPLANLQVTDDLHAAFGAGSIMIIESVSPSAGFSANTAYDGESAGDIDLLTGTDTLAVGASMAIELGVTVAPTTPVPGPYDNQVTASGIAVNGTPVFDLSSPGADPVLGDEPAPTSFTFAPAPSIGAAKQLVSGPTVGADGFFTMSFRFVVDNLGNTPLLGLLLDDDLTLGFGDDATFEIVNLEASAPFDVEPAYDGAENFRMLPETGTLGVGESMTVDLTVRVLPTSLGTYENFAIAKALSPSNAALVDETTDGSVSDPDLDGEPIEDYEPTIIVLDADVALDAATEMLAEPTANADGSWRMDYEIRVTNGGDVDIDELNLVENIAMRWPGRSFTIVSVTSDDVTVNDAYDGVGVAELLDGSATLTPGETVSVRLVIDVEDGDQLAVDGAVVTGRTPWGGTVDAAAPDTTTTTTITTTTTTTTTTSTTTTVSPDTTEPGAGGLPFTTVPPNADGGVPTVGDEELPFTGPRDAITVVAGLVLLAGGLALIVGTRHEIAKRSYYLR